MESRGDKLVCLFFIHFRDVSGGYSIAAVGAEYGPVVFWKVYGTLDYPLVIHFYKVAVAHFLIFGYETMAIGAGNLKDMAASDLFAVWIFIYFHFITKPQLLIACEAHNERIPVERLSVR